MEVMIKKKGAARWLKTYGKLAYVRVRGIEKREKELGEKKKEERRASK